MSCSAYFGRICVISGHFWLRLASTARPSIARRRAAAAALLLLGGMAVALAAEPRDPATLAPGNAIAYAEWSKISGGDSSVLSMAAGALRADFMKELLGREARQITGAVTALEQAGRYTGCVALLPGAHGPSAVATIDAGADADGLVKSLLKSLGHAPPDAKAAKQTVGGIDFQREDDGPLWATKDGRILIAMDADGAAVLADLLSGKDKKPLAQAAEFKLCRGKLKSNSDWRFVAWVDLPAILKLAGADKPADAKSMDSKMWKVSNLEAFRSVIVLMDDASAGSRFACFAHVDNFKHGLPRLYDQPGITDADLNCIPKDASWATVTKLDLRATFDDAVSEVKKADPQAGEQVEGMAATVATLAGMTTDDLFGALGDTWALYDSPSHAGVSITGMVLVGETKNPKAVHGLLSRLAQGVAAAGFKGVKVKLEQSKDGEHTIHYVVFAGAPSPVAPAWGFVGDRFVIGFSPQSVAVALRQVDPKTRKESILAADDFKRVRPQLAKELSSFWYSDIRATYSSTYGLFTVVRTMIASVSANSDGATPIAAIPPYPDALGSARNTVGGCTRDADGVLYISYGGLPGAALLTNSNVAGSALAISILLPSLSRARELAKRAVSSANLRGIGQACHIYANDNKDKFPDRKSVV